MIKKLKYPFLLLFTCLCSCEKSELLNEKEKTWLDNQNEITVALFPYYAPYQFINENEKIDGIFIDYLSLIENKLTYKFHKKIYTNWEHLINDAKVNKIDLILEIQQTEERDKYLSFHSKLLESNYSIVTRKNTNRGTKLKDFYNKTITVPKDYGIHEILREQEKQLIIAPEIDDLTSLKKLNNGSYDAYIGPKAVANYLIKTENLENVSIVSETPYYYAPSIAVQKNNEILNQVIRKASNAISNAEKDLIFGNWLYDEIIPFYRKTMFWAIISISAICITIIILLLNRYLKYLIRKKTKELSVAKERAEESNKLKTAFIHNISHEVRTPMNGIIGFSELLSSPGLTTEKQKEYATIVMNSSEQLIHVIEDIIEVSKLQIDKIEINLETINVSDLLNVLRSKFDGKAKNKNIDIIYTNLLEDSQNIIINDKVKILKILYNLIDNAIKFTNEGTIEISCQVKDSNIVFIIQDTGIGIKQEDQELIFRNFSQSEQEATKNYDGLGLGLSISRKLANLLDGDISFISTLDKGSTFKLTLPYHQSTMN